jgi:hypothetical protein
MPADLVQGALDAADKGAGAADDGGIDVDVRGENGDVNSLGSDSLLEEPVTSGGDSSLWGENEEDEEEAEGAASGPEQE